MSLESYQRLIQANPQWVTDADRRELEEAKDELGTSVAVVSRVFERQQKELEENMGRFRALRDQVAALPEAPLRAVDFLQNLRKEPDYADLILIASDGEVKGHLVVLKEIPFFNNATIQRMGDHPISPQHPRTIQMPDVTAKVLHQFLNYMHEFGLPKDLDDYEPLFHFAMFLGFDTLIKDLVLSLMQSREERFVVLALDILSSSSALKDFAVQVKQDIFFSQTWKGNWINKFFPELQKRARDGHEGALILLGELYQNNNPIQSFACFRRAADREDSYAQALIGTCYARGCGIPRDVKKAAEFFTLSAEQGNPLGQVGLSRCYREEGGVVKDLKKAAELAILSAQQGQAQGLLELGYLYEYGIGVEKDPKAAFKQYSLAAAQDFLHAIALLGICYENGIGIAEDQKKAIELYTRAANEKDSIACAYLGKCYLDGSGVDQDIEKGVALIACSAEQADANGEYFYARCCENGIGVPQDLNKAIDYYRRAAKDGGRLEAREDLERLTENLQQGNHHENHSLCSRLSSCVIS